MARSAAARAASYRSRPSCGLDAVLVDIDPQAALNSGLMTAAEWADAEERRQILLDRRVVADENIRRHAVTGWFRTGLQFVSCGGLASWFPAQGKRLESAKTR